MFQLFIHMCGYCVQCYVFYNKIKVRSMSYSACMRHCHPPNCRVVTLTSHNCTLFVVNLLLIVQKELPCRVVDKETKG